jgi:hypothetical protein
MLNEDMVSPELEPALNLAKSRTAERRARTLRPTVYCPSTAVEECLRESRTPENL